MKVVRGPGPQGPVRPVQLTTARSVVGVCCGLDLHEGQADVGERVAHRRWRPAPSRSPRPSTRQATASMASAASPRSWGIGAEVDRRQLVQTHHVVDDHGLGGDLGQRGPGVVRAPSAASSTTDSVSSLLTCAILSADNSREVGWLLAAHSHPATHASATVRPGHDHTSRAVLVAVSSACWWLRSQTHRKGSTHCTGVISHSTAAATGAPVQRPHPGP